MRVSTDPTLWLDFVNTEVMEEGDRVDRLPDPRALVAWLAERGLSGGGSAGRAGGAHRAARELRVALRAQADRMSKGKAPSEAGAAAINEVLAGAPVIAQVAREGGRFRSRWRVGGDDPKALLFPVADSFRGFLETADPALVRRCCNPACILYFYDTTKNRSRRWCSMQVCGNRAKGAAYYRRRQQRRRGQEEGR